MPVFIALVFLAAALLWLLASFLFIPLGKLSKRLWGDVKDAMTKDDSEEKENEP